MSAIAARMMLGAVVLPALMFMAADAQMWAVTEWTAGAHATFYGGQDASGTMGECSDRDTDSDLLD